VTVSMPYGYQVWATGEWQNPGEVLADSYLSRWQKAHESTSVMAIFTEKELQSGVVFRPSSAHQFRFVAKDVPDFAFAASSTFNWDATTTIADKKTNRKTFISAVYDTKSTDYPQVAQITSDGIRLMSEWLPGYPFPYPSMTVFNGNDGMEYPMMCNDASTAPGSPMTLTIHEVSHTYFPFMMGINEQDYAWMDEGWAAFFDYKLSDSLSGHKEGRVRPYSSIAGTDNDVPPMVRSRNLTSAYRNAAYQRPSMAYFTLLDLLGYERFHHCMTEYINRWQGKHPAPFDFFNTWNDASGENLDWFWKPWFFDWGYPDLAIKGISKSGKDEYLDIELIGSIPVPIHLELAFTDETKITVHETAKIWKGNSTQCRIKLPRGSTLKSAKMGLATIPDANMKDNEWKQ
jgi:Peptidase family M1 domain